MRKVFLEELPSIEKGTNKGKINWKESVGNKVHFIYDDIEDDLEIIDYYMNSKGKYHLIIKHKNNEISIFTESFKKCMIGKLLNKRTNEFKVEIGTTFKDKKRNITIIDREYRINKRGGKEKYYKYHCNIDGNEDWIKETHLLNNVVCNVCSGRKPMLGINTIWVKARWMCDLGVSEEDAKRYMPCSHDNIYVICPNCKTVKKTKPINIYMAKSIACNCGDGNSYPNKFMIEFCNQLLKQDKIKSFETEYNIKNKRYDLYIELINKDTLIIENHGGQHGEFIYNGDLLYIKSTKGFNSRNEISNDINKCRLAYDNNINNYIQLDCSESDIEYIKRSIENSILNKLFDLSNINWLECEKYALKNIVKEVCDYWNNKKEEESITSIGKIFKISRPTTREYLKKGCSLGWCNYSIQ